MSNTEVFEDKEHVSKLQKAVRDYHENNKVFNQVHVESAHEKCAIKFTDLFMENYFATNKSDTPKKRWDRVKKYYENICADIATINDSKFSSISSIIRDYFISAVALTLLPEKVIEMICDLLTQNNVRLLIDLFTGNGFVPFRFKLHGFDVYASDIKPCRDLHWLEVKRQNAEKFDFNGLKTYKESEQCLVLSWVPHQADEVDDVGILKRFQGDFVLWIGEEGSCGSWKLHVELSDNWESLSILHIPRFPQISDFIEIFRRRKQQDSSSRNGKK